MVVWLTAYLIRIDGRLRARVVACIGRPPTSFTAFSESSVLALIKMSFCLESCDYLLLFYGSNVEMKFYIW